MSYELNFTKHCGGRQTCWTLRLGIARRERVSPKRKSCRSSQQISALDKPSAQGYVLSCAARWSLDVPATGGEPVTKVLINTDLNDVLPANSEYIRGDRIHHGIVRGRRPGSWRAAPWALLDSVEPARRWRSEPQDSACASSPSIRRMSRCRTA